MFPTDSSHKAEDYEKVAKDLNAMRKKNTRLKPEDLIKTGDDEVCRTFEEYAGLFNDKVKIKGKNLQVRSRTFILATLNNQIIIPIHGS